MYHLPKDMSAVVLTGHGGPEMLQFKTDISLPSPASNEVLIKVGAAAVNNTDINTRIAWYSKSDSASEDASWSGQSLSFPRIQGADVCGVIVAVGQGVNSSRIGERVLIEPCIREYNGEILRQPWYFGSECDGGFAEYTTVSSSHAYKITSTLTDVELASFPCSYSTAENLLTKANVKSGETVLVTGASGGVGSAAVQLAKARDAKVIAVTSNEKSKDVLKLGAATTLSRTQSIVETLGKNSVDVVIDLVAGKQWGELLDALKPGGRYAVAGAIAGPIVELDIRTLYLKDLSFFGCTVLESEVFGNLIRHIESGAIKPVVARSFQLDQIAEAQELFLQKSHTGKIVLSVAKESLSSNY
ncbi:MAG: alcohol dehydrogenase family protein [Paraglaciecola sp.]|uniref:alcohol dehydrogenase family protein n=1 Tax=Paraglaciecola sp. TaxID=1920173 RepID=UPI0032975BE1